MNQQLMIFSGLLKVIIIKLSFTYHSSKFIAAKFLTFYQEIIEEAVSYYSYWRMENKEFKFKGLNRGM